MKVIIHDAFYEFQNERTDEIFEHQKNYLTELIAGCEAAGDDEALLTHLYSLSNLTEMLIDRYVEHRGLDQTVRALRAKPIKKDGSPR